MAFLYCRDDVIQVYNRSSVEALFTAYLHAGKTNGLRHGTQFDVPTREEVVTVCVGMHGERRRWSSACHVVAKILKCSKNFKVSRVVPTRLWSAHALHGCHAFREQFVTYAWQMAQHGANCQTMRHLAVLTDFVPVKWHDLARHIAGHCGNKIRATMRLT